MGKNKCTMSITATNGSGLGNRIKAIVSSMRLHSDARVYWPKVPGVLSCELSDLFLNEFEIAAPQGKQYSSWRFALKKTDQIPEGFSLVTADKDKIGRKFSFTDPRRRNIDLEFHRIPSEIRDEYVSIFNRLQINPTVQQWVENFSHNFDKNTVSVHIRSWEDQDPDEESRLRQKHFFSLNNFIQEMYKFDNNTKFFVCSDSQKVIAKLEKLFYNRIITYRRHSKLETSRSTRIGAQDDLAEMLLLSKNKVILGSYISTFTEMAWWFGGAKAEVRIC